MLHKPFIARQLTRSGQQAVVFVGCVALSIVTIIALNGFSSSVHDALLKDGRALHGGDIIIHSHRDFSPALSDGIAAMEKRGLIGSTTAYEFYSVVRPSGGGAESLLASLKVVEPPYPFYGAVELKSGRRLGEVLVPGSIVVEQSLLDRLSARVGDSLHVGSTVLTIRDVVLRESDRPVAFFSFGPRLFASMEDLDAMDLVKKGSRIQHDLLIKVADPARIDALADELRALGVKGEERVETFRTAPSRVKKFFDNFLFFLGLVSVFTLLLAGIGIHSVLGAFFKEKEPTIAIMKTVGATSRFVTTQFLTVFCVLGGLGTLAGLAFGSLLQTLLPALFRGLIPQSIQPSFSFQMVMEGFVLGIAVVGLFTFLPLYRMRQLKPSAVFRKDELPPQRGIVAFIAVLAIAVLFLGMVWWQARNDITVGLWYVLGVVAFLAVPVLITQGVLSALRRVRVKSLVFRQALRGLFRPRNATRSIIITLTASLAIIFSISLIERNIDAAFVQSYPLGAPNVFFVDIQPDQLEPFSQELGMQAEYYPVIRGRMTDINGAPINAELERERRGDNLAREFNLTYRDHLLPDERLVQGEQLFRDDWEGLQVSVLDAVLKMRPMEVGDAITFRIQGVPIRARISSIRTRTGELIQPFFYFVFQEEALKDAPQTLFTALRIDRDRIVPLQTRLVSRFPNVSVIDLSQTISTLAEVMHKLSGITRFFTLFSVIAGVLILVSSVYATRYTRVQEAVYFKILGARSDFVLRVFTLENLFLGLVSGLLALTLSQAGSWIVSARLLEISYKPFPGASVLMVLATLALAALVGLLSSLSVLRQKPIDFLREQTEE
ncbi:MAG: ABC transporter permease [Syntrophobacteraceae bacterium]